VQVGEKNQALRGAGLFAPNGFAEKQHTVVHAKSVNRDCYRRLLDGSPGWCTSYSNGPRCPSVRLSV